MNSEHDHKKNRASRVRWLVPPRATRAASLRFLLPSASALLIGCGAASWQVPPHDTLFQEAPPPKSHPPPAEIEPTEWLPVIWYSSFAQWSRGVSPGWHVERALGGPPALDVNAFGKVPDSSWFENRTGRRRMSVAEIARGPNVHPPPDTRQLVVHSGKIGGVTPGFVVKDASGVRWIIKFDHPAFPELSSGAEMVGTKLLYAAGYHVPENHVVSFDVENISLASDATTRDRYNRKVPFRWSDLREGLALLNPGPDGRARALFSRFLPGVPLGPAPLHGTRPDDPNDRIPHERRRSLRGLWVFYAWINNTDAKYSNTLDMFQVTDQRSGTGHIEHYLIDFGTSFGATPSGPKPRYEGHEYKVDWSGMGTRLFTVGVQYPYWATVHGTPYRSIGKYEAEVFEPGRWHPKYPNPVFEAADAHDTFWAASILARFGPMEIAAAVSSAHYSEPSAADWLAEVALARRNKLLKHAFREMAPLDDPQVNHRGKLELIDLAVLAGIVEPEQVRYRWKAHWHVRSSETRAVAAGEVSQPALYLGPLVDKLTELSAGALGEAPFVTLSWRRRVEGKTPGPELDVHLRVLDDGRVVPVGLRRQVR